MKIFLLFIFSLSVAPFNTLSGQQRELDTLIKKINTYGKNNLQEKIYLHLDRNFYVTGEILWFKIYCTDATIHQPLSLSKVAYVEILDQNNINVLQAKVALEKGSGHGSLFLPASLNSSIYTVRAYTQWMKNFSPDFYFHQPITIVNPFIKTETASPKAGIRVVNFFPEGGNLVSGVKSKVAFRVTDNTGIGIDCSGTIITEGGDTITKFQTEKFGIGHFYLSPEKQVYKAVIRDPHNTTTIHELPPIDDTGYVMNLRDSSDQYLRLEVRKKVVGEPDKLFLIVHARNIISHAGHQYAFKNATVFKIDKNILPDGISHLTIFDGSLKPICERLYFKYPSRKLDVKIESSQQQFGIRRKVSMKIQPGISADLSVSVYKADSLGQEETNTIFPFLWLTSELKGRIESPAYYFSNDPLAKNAMDNLMLTHGWRRFKWNDILERGVEKKYAPEYRGQIIKGRVIDNQGKPASGRITYLASPDKVIRLYPSVSNSKGEVKYEAENLIGQRQIIAQTMADSVLKIELENPFSTEFSSWPPASFKLAPNMEASLIERSISMQVQDIYNERNRDSYVFPGLDSNAFYGKADETYYLDDYTRFPVMEEVMREYVPGVLVRKKRDGFNFIVFDDVHKILMRDPPLILIDGVPLFDADEIMAFDPRKIKKLEVVRRPYYLGPTLFQGIVSYTTYKGDLGGFILGPKKNLIDFEGLQLQREFYSPQYDNQKLRADRTPDQRTLLYWSPQVLKGKDGNYSVDFYTSDIDGNYIVMVQGMTSDGLSGSSSYGFSVKLFEN